MGDMSWGGAMDLAAERAAALEEENERLRAALREVQHIVETDMPYRAPEQMKDVWLSLKRAYLGVLSPKGPKTAP